MRGATLVLVVVAALLGSPARPAAQAPERQAQPSAAPSPTMGQLPISSSPFLGGVPTGTVTTEPLSLSIADAITRALEHNLGVLMSEDTVGRARGARWLALSELLPNANGRLSEVRQKVNLAAFGFPLPPGIPPVVGPFNVFDVRASVSQAVVDLRALNDLRTENHNIAAAQFSQRSARDLVVLVAATSYLQALAASSRSDVARVQTQTAQALYQQALDLRQSGIVAGIDVLRAEVELNAERQRSTAAQNDFEKSKLQLARIIGLPLGQTFTLVTELPNVPVPDLTLDDALARAYRDRPDYQAALERVRAAETARAAIVGEALPAVRVNADYGDIGLTPGTAVATYTLAGAITVPIFQGGRTHGRLLEADAELRNRRAEADDMKAGIYYDVRSAFLDLQASGEQLQVATRGRDLANTALTQSRDRFAAGVASNIEVIQAQEAVAVANEQYITALYLYNVSKAALARGLGVAEQSTREFLGGVR